MLGLLMATSNVPTEIVFKILTHIIIACVHDIICNGSEDRDWKLRVYPVLCLVNKVFRDVATDIVTRAFAIGQDESEGNIFKAFRSRLFYLRDAGVKLRDSKSTVPARLPPGSSFHCQANSLPVGLHVLYSKYLATLTLRRQMEAELSRMKDSTALPGLFLNTHRTIRGTLVKALKMCGDSQCDKKVEGPREILDSLKGDMKIEAVVVENALALVKAGIDLDSDLKKLSRLNNREAVVTCADELRKTELGLFNTIHFSVSVIEASQKQYLRATNEPRVLPVVIMPVSQIPGLERAIRHVSTMELSQSCLDDLDVQGRAKKLLEEWSEREQAGKASEEKDG